MTKNERKQMELKWERIGKWWMRPESRWAENRPSTIDAETTSEPRSMDSTAKKAYHFIIESK